MGTMRSDARRNRERLVAAARDAFAAHGPEAPLDGIARQSGLGSGTLYRHFPTRDSLMRAVYWGEVVSLQASGRELLAAPSPGAALVDWLRLLIALVSRRGLAAALMARMPDVPAQFVADCHEAMRAAAAPLLARAQAAGEIRPDLSLAELLGLVHAVGLVTDASERGPDRADRLLALVVEGLRGGGPARP